MATVKCKESNGYKITPGGDYEVISETSEFYIVINDNEKQVRYSKKLFEETAAPVRERRRTERDMISSITNTENGVSFVNIAGETVGIISSLRFTDSNISCGVGQMYDINSMMNTIATTFRNFDDDYLDLRKALLKALINKAVASKRTLKAMLMMSTNINGNDTDLLSAINEIASITSEDKTNPNSSNTIRTWIFYTS